ncbi:MAG: glycosyl transferase [Acidobacteria bacterium]|nr:MAG: glycosyl transferase [Acidobacteriota bacterium]
MLTYVIITPARNEAQYIELTIRSVVAQTVRPLKWVIVSDGSTDGTDAIVSRYAAEHPWIELLRMPERRERHFAGKVHAFNAGLARMAGLSFDLVVNLDGDISFEKDYFSFLQQRLAEDPHLGLVSGRLVDADSNQDYYDYKYTGIEHVSGACQIFRRECFEAIGGYRPIKAGGIDLLAVLSARAKGWRTRTFVERACLHHRPMGAAHVEGLRERLHTGYKDYLLGSHPLWELFRSFYQMTKRPYVIGGVCIFLGYFWMVLRRAERTIPEDLVGFRRKEQIRRLRHTLRLVPRASVAPALPGGYNAQRN